MENGKWKMENGKWKIIILTPDPLGPITFYFALFSTS